MSAADFLAGHGRRWPAAARDARPRLNVYNWSAYVAPETIPSFEAEFGVRVRYATYESNEEMLAKVLTGNSGWDVVFPTHNRLPPMREYGLLAPLRPRMAARTWPTWTPRFRAPAWDPGLAWGVPYMWNGTGIVYNRSVAPAPTRWADLWDPAPEGPPHHARRSRGRARRLPEEARAIRSAPRTRASCARAEREAIAQKPLLRAYLNAEVRDQLVSGDVLAAQLWSTTAQQAIDAAPELAFVYPGRGLPALLRLRRDPARKPARRDWRTSSWITCCGRRFRRRSCEATKTATANGAALALLPESVRQHAASLPAARGLRAGRVAAHLASGRPAPARPHLDGDQVGLARTTISGSSLRFLCVFASLR